MSEATTSVEKDDGYYRTKYDLIDSTLQGEFKPIPDDLTNELKEAFALFQCDMKNDAGVIDVKDIGNTLRACGQNPTEKDVEDMMKDCELQDDTLIDFDEFMRVVSQKEIVKDGLTMEDELEQAFKTWDDDGDGLCHIGKVREMLSTLGERLPEDDLQELCKLAEPDADGYFSIADMVRKMTAK